MAEMIELTGFVLTSVAAGVLGNRADALLCDAAGERLYDRLRQSGPSRQSRPAAGHPQSPPSGHPESCSPTP
jgi:hypothetical protein